MRVAVIAAVVVCSHLAHAGRGAGILIPPAEVDYGVGGTLGAEAVTGASTEVLAGLHWASLYWKPTPIDIGVGYVGVWRDVLPQYAALETMPTPTLPNQNQLHLDGVYVDLAYALSSTRYIRTWLSGRAEWLNASVNQTSFVTHGFALRISSELFGQTVGAKMGSGGGAVIAGTVAVGLYVEASHRDLPAELGPDALTAGVSLRLPFILAGVN